ncbi:myosin light chain 5 [Struthio camelus]|uniref:myosin light chain 5 n=1 Tax=Struthio camelus TaxID=8801 RepID=UPI003603B8E9
MSGETCTGGIILAAGRGKRKGGQQQPEALTVIDHNRDGFIAKEDLKDTYASLGKTNIKDEELECMLKEASGPINFTMFLNLFGEKLSDKFKVACINFRATLVSTV